MDWGNGCYRHCCFMSNWWLCCWQDHAPAWYFIHPYYKFVPLCQSQSKSSSFGDSVCAMCTILTSQMSSNMTLSHPTHMLRSFGILPWDWTQWEWACCPGVPCTDAMGNWLSWRYMVSLIHNTKGHFSGSMAVMLFMMVFWIAVFNDKCKAGLHRQTRTKQCSLSLHCHICLNKSSTWPSKIVLRSVNNTEGE